MSLKRDKTSGMNTTAQKPANILSPILVDAAKVGELLSLSRVSIFAAHAAGKIFRPVRPGVCDPRWSVREIEAWIQAGCPARETWEARKGVAQ